MKLKEEKKPSPELQSLRFFKWQRNVSLSARFVTAYCRFSFEFWQIELENFLSVSSFKLVSLSQTRERMDTGGTSSPRLCNGQKVPFYF